jgi:hypothetical protein
MPLFGRNNRPPQLIVAQLVDDERVVSWADAADDRVVAATQRGLLWPDADGHRRIGWEHVDKAVWHDGELSVVVADVVDDLLLVDQPAMVLALVVPRDLPPTVRKRIDANVVHTALHPVPGGAARFVARRVPGQDGLAWWARLEPDVIDDELVRTAVRRQIEALRTAHDAER